MVIFHSYVSLPEGRLIPVPLECFNPGFPEVGLDASMFVQCRITESSGHMAGTLDPVELDIQHRIQPINPSFSSIQWDIAGCVAMPVYESTSGHDHTCIYSRKLLGCWVLSNVLQAMPHYFYWWHPSFKPCFLSEFTVSSIILIHYYLLLLLLLLLLFLLLLLLFLFLLLLLLILLLLLLLLFITITIAITFTTNIITSVN